MVRTVCVLFSLMVFVCPWFIGGNYPFARTVLLSVNAVILLLVGLGLWGARKSFRPRSARVPLVWWMLIAGVGYTAFQALPQSAAIQDLYGHEADFMLAGHDGPERFERSISVYPPATRSKLVDLLYGVGLFFGACLVLRTRGSAWLVFACLTAVGVLVSFVGVLQMLSGSDKILWTYELLWGGTPFGSFVNPNNAAGFLLISLSTGMYFVAQMLLSLGQNSQGFQPGGGNEFLLQRSSGVLSRLKSSVSRLEPSHLYFLTAVLVIIAGVLMTRSRSGIVTLVLVVLSSGLLLSRANPLAVFCLVAVLVGGAVGVVVYSEQADRVSVQLQTLTDLSDAGAPRLQHWEEAVPFGIANVLVGTGNGTYRYVSPGFQKAFTAKNFAHAENVYLETLVEMGGGGLFLLLFCVFYCLHVSVKLYRQKDVSDRALGVAGISCVCGQAFIGAFDFGIYQPANTTAMALVMGAMVGRHCELKNSVQLGNHKTATDFVTVLLLGLLAVGTFWAVYESYGIESMRSAKRSLKLLNYYGKHGPNKTRQVSLENVRQKLELAESFRPDDTDVQFLIGSLEVSQFRLLQSRELNQVVKKGLKELDDFDLNAEARRLRREQLEKYNSETIWNVTAVPILHQQLRERQRQSPELVEELLASPGVRTHLCEAMKRFKNADALFSLLPKTRVRMAQLAAITQHEGGLNNHQQEFAHIDEALSRSTPKTQTLFSCGLLALNSGNQDLAVELWRKCLRQPHLFAHEKVIVELCLQMVPMRRLYEEIFPQDPKYLIRMAGRYMRSPEMMLPKKFLVVHIKCLIEQSKDLSELEKKVFLARAARHVNDYPAVAANYRAALSLASELAPWRYDYAFALFKTKQFDEAVRQLKLCELDPTFPKNRTKQLLKRIRTARSNP